jgi:hypothetical protein
LLCGQFENNKNIKDMNEQIKETDHSIRVLELRNYLLKPGMTNSFIHYFNQHFVKPMYALGGYALVQATIESVPDRFVWMRGFDSMDTRLKFLEDFYLNSPEWKTYGPGANDMMINSDNVYLLRPLNYDKSNDEKIRSLNSSLLKLKKEVVVIDFYICNSTLHKVIDLFKNSYLPFLQSRGIHDITSWVSEMEENKFPKLPVFQDKNLLLTISHYKDINEYYAQLQSLTPELKRSIDELVTTQHSWVLCARNTE